MSINPNSRLSLTIAGALTLGGFLIASSWRASNYLRDIRDEVADMRREVQAMSNDQWSVSDQDRWAYQLEKLNRETGLKVPETRMRRQDRMP